MRALAIVVLLGACAVHVPPVAPAHPASPDAPTGRLAGAPPALRPGVVTYEDVPAMREGPPSAHQHHHHHQ